MGLLLFLGLVEAHVRQKIHASVRDALAQTDPVLAAAWADEQRLRRQRDGWTVLVLAVLIFGAIGLAAL